jgi:hypothetical protein
LIGATTTRKHPFLKDSDFSKAQFETDNYFFSIPFNALRSKSRKADCSVSLTLNSQGRSALPEAASPFTKGVLDSCKTTVFRIPARPLLPETGVAVRVSNQTTKRGALSP